MAIDVEHIAAKEAPAVAKALVAAARQGGTEADFRREAAQILEQAGAAAGLTIIPRDEFSVARGRVDSVYNRLILEYKRPGVIREDLAGKSNQTVIRQVQDYILDVAKREKREAPRLAGVATDGFHFIFVRRVGEGWSEPELFPVNAATTERFLRLLFSLSAGAALVPENLVEDFGPATLRAQRAVRSLYTALHGTKHPLVLKLFEQWRLFFSEATDYREWAAKIESKEEFRVFVKGMGLDPKYAEAPKIFFALHTYYALLIKLVASLAAARFAGGNAAPLTGMAAKTGGKLRDAFADLERGGLFREYGIRNFLEGDFFGWYTTAWDDDIEDAVGELVRRLSEYDPGTLELAPENARDLLKKLYHFLLPREIRHDLGEYYTPDWLAERLVIQTLGKADLGDSLKRVLDPACGSGTFLVILIKHIRDRAAQKKLDPAKVLEQTLTNVVGFDLNPLAVIAARTNYLLALGDLLKARSGDIDIPVYQADSVLTPSQGTDLFDGNVYPLKTAVGVFRVPSLFADRSRMDVLANVLDQDVEAEVAPRAFLQHLKEPANLTDEELESAGDDLAALYSQLHQLHREDLNGVWARIIKNAFAPSFLEPCDYVVGNPPWVNWEHLPDEYRGSTISLWHHYGMIPQGGIDSLMGKVKMDLAMLMTYVCADKYLRRAGKLGFVLPQNHFKASEAARGFRRFILPDKTPFGPLLVEDMVALNPFEGATNRTATAIFSKGHHVTYPVPYERWEKSGSGRGSSVGFDTPLQDVLSNKSRRVSWFAEPVDPRDQTSSWLTGRREAIKALHKVQGNAAYTARQGANTGGANAVFWVEILSERPGGLCVVANVTENAKRRVQNVQASIESDLLYPLLRGRDISRWSATPSIQLICTREPDGKKAISVERMEAKFPRALSYFQRFREPLKARKDAVLMRSIKTGLPFYAIGAVNDYTFARWKVVWREVGNSLDAAVIGIGEVAGTKKPIVPDHTCIFVVCDSQGEAHYLCAAINSRPARLLIQNYIVLHPDTHILSNVRVPAYAPKDKAHNHLSELSQDAHRAAGKGETASISQIEDEIDRWAAKLWGLSQAELTEIENSLEEARS